MPIASNNGNNFGNGFSGNTGTSGPPLRNPLGQIGASGGMPPLYGGLGAQGTGGTASGVTANPFGSAPYFGGAPPPAAPPLMNPGGAPYFAGAQGGGAPPLMGGNPQGAPAQFGGGGTGLPPAFGGGNIAPGTVPMPHPGAGVQQGAPYAPYMGGYQINPSQYMPGNAAYDPRGGQAAALRYLGYGGAGGYIGNAGYGNQYGGGLPYGANPYGGNPYGVGGMPPMYRPQF